MADYRVINNHTVRLYQHKLIKDCYTVHSNFKRIFPDGDSTEYYKYYNVFCATAPDPVWYNIFTDLKSIIREFIGHNNPLWVQSWLNFHQENEVLDWHNHFWDYHGYISIDPKNSETEFRNYTIKNIPGNIYIGPGNREHRVVVKRSYSDGPRITLGFDIKDNPSNIYNQMSLIPI